MIRYVARRLGLAIIVITGVVVLTFVIARLVPADPASSWAGPKAGPAQIAQARADLGLDRPVLVQIVNWIGGVVTGDWGVSVHTHQPVLSDIAARLPVSLQLIITTLIVSMFVGVLLGLVAARWPHRPPDQLVRVLTVIGGSMPVFWMGVMLQLVFFERLGWLPNSGPYDQQVMDAYPLTRISGMPALDALLTGNWPMLRDSVVHMILPMIVLSTYPVALSSRMVRASLLDSDGDTHVQFVRALGFPEREVLGRFAMRLAWPPLIQVTALMFAYGLVNIFLVEAVFNWPGVGKYAAESVASFDTPAVLGITLFIATVYVVANLIVDLIQARLDPRIRWT